MLGAYYNEHDDYAADWLEGLIAAGAIPAGIVDRRGVQEVCAPESREGSTTPATYGPYSKASSSSDVLQSCLANSLRMRLNGSEMCETIWKKWNTPWGPCLLKPRARVRTTSAIDSTLWPTATTSNGGSNSASAAVCLRGHGTNLIGVTRAADGIGYGPDHPVFWIDRFHPNSVKRHTALAAIGTAQAIRA